MTGNTHGQTGERSAPRVTGALDGETKWVAGHPPRHNTDCWLLSQDQWDNWSYYTLDQTDEVNRKHYPGLFLHICHHLNILPPLATLQHSSLNTSHTAGALAMVFTVCVVMMVLNVSDVMFTSERQSVMVGRGSSVDWERLRETLHTGEPRSDRGGYRPDFIKLYLRSRQIAVHFLRLLLTLLTRPFYYDTFQVSLFLGLTRIFLSETGFKVLTFEKPFSYFHAWN